MTVSGSPRATLICAHGAGGHKDDRGMLRLARALQFLDVVRFDFPYREKGSGRPDPMPVLKDSIAAVAQRRRAPGAKLLLGGRSMGGRAASLLAADSFACDGLMLFAYPLHPAGKPEQMRTAHWPRIGVPVLCVNGTRDPLCTRELMENELARVDHWTMHWIEGADHSFRVLKSSGRTEDEVYEEIGRAAARWVEPL